MTGGTQTPQELQTVCRQLAVVNMIISKLTRALLDASLRGGTLREGLAGETRMTVEPPK